MCTVLLINLCDFFQDILRNHVAARAGCLFVFPILLYLLQFFVLFSVLTTTGPHDDQMSSAFQRTLKVIKSKVAPEVAKLNLKSIGKKYMLEMNTPDPMRAEFKSFGGKNMLYANALAPVGNLASLSGKS